MTVETIKYYGGTVGHCLITLIASIFYLEFFAVGLFLGREITQTEYRYIANNGGKRYECPWYCGFIPKYWTIKSLLDWLLPFIIATLTYVWR